MMATDVQKYYRFRCEDWSGSWYDLPAPLTMDTLYPILKSEGWQGKKEDYRLIPVKEGLLLDANKGNRKGIKKWRTVQILAEVIKEQSGRGQG